MLKWITANGKELKLKEPYKLLDFEGGGIDNTDIQTQKAPFQNGSTLIDQLLEDRDIFLEIAILGENRQDIYNKRRKLVSYFNTKAGKGKLVWEQENKSYEADAVPEEVSFPGGDGSIGGFQEAIILLSCPDPAWQDIKDTVQSLGLIEGGLMFPLMLNADEVQDTVFAQRGEETMIEIEGDLSSPVKLEFQGPAENPKVTNETTDEFIKINKALEDNEKLIINTKFGEKSVIFEDNESNRESAFNRIDLDSVFFQLKPGKNVISFDSDIDKEDARVVITYRNRYAGV